jgi:D-3-phosphoglycerate dehydrogenase / 2-oxoglutarate reductase
MKILVTIPNITPEALTLLEGAGEVLVVSPERKAVMEAIPDCDAAFIGLGVVFDKELLSRAPLLKVIATATTGLDHIDLMEAEKRGVEVLSLRGEDAFLDTITGTAELALAFMLSLARRLGRAHRHVVEDGLWRREDFRGQSLYGKTLGIVGMGRLGSILARAADGLRMRVVFSDTTVREGPIAHHTRIELEELLRVSDFVSIHVHLHDDTRGIFSTSAFKAMKPSAYLINTSRGDIVDEAALIEALRAGEIAGYATDVLAGEGAFGDRVPLSHPLIELARDHESVLIVPHLGGMTEDSRRATDVFMADKLTRHLERRKDDVTSI